MTDIAYDSSDRAVMTIAIRASDPSRPMSDRCIHARQLGALDDEAGARGLPQLAHRVGRRHLLDGSRSPLMPGTRGRSVVQTAARVSLLPLPAGGSLGTFIGQCALVINIPVQSLASHPGSWIGTGAQRIHVHITDPANVRLPVRVGDHVSFQATVQSNPPGFAATDGVDPREGAQALWQPGAHIVGRVNLSWPRDDDLIWPHLLLRWG